MNRNTSLKRIWIAIVVLALAVLACGPKVVSTPAVTPVVQQPAPATNLSQANLIYAAVQIFGANIVNGDIIPIYVGSGSIISRDGLILTNAHVASPASKGGQDPDLLVIGIVQSEDQPPVYAYLAEVRAVDGYMDLAVIQITATLEGDSVNPASLNLTFIPVGDSDQVHVRDHINIYGFPAIGGNTITYTSGSISGFAAEDQLGDRAWLKTDATISGGNSGGMVANDEGQLIGVPTIAASGADVSEAVDCRVIQDTNNDGVVDEDDTCIPLGGFINGLRPVNLARPLIQAAKNNQLYSSPYGGGLVGGTPGNGNEYFGPVTWVEVTSLGPCETGNSVDNYSSETLGLAAVFEFSGMTAGQSWAESWTYEGQTVFESVYVWDQGASGTFTDCLTNGGDTIPVGSYHVEFYAGPGDNLPLLTQGDVVVGEGQPPVPPSPQAGVQISGTVYDQDTENPIEGALVFILKTGVSFDDWDQHGYTDDDVFTLSQTDSQGYFSLTDNLERNTPYTLVVYAEGYLTSYGDDLVWSDDEPADFSMDIPLTK